MLSNPFNLSLVTSPTIQNHMTSKVVFELWVRATGCHPLMGLSLQDAPRDCETPVVVTSYKPGQGGCCLRCHYIHRGSFKSMSLNALEAQLSEHAPLKEKCFGLRIGPLSPFSPQLGISPKLVANVVWWEMLLMQQLVSQIYID